MILFITNMVIVCVISSEINCAFGVPQDVAEESAMDLPALVTKYGYHVETHEVITDDGYRLKIFRMPRRKSSNTNNRIPVFLMHGFVGSAGDWIMNPPKYGLGYILADAGYDVWMGNARGSYYSRSHISKSPSDRDFWFFSWHEIGIYDIPRMIDYVLSTNGLKKLHYIAHSQGTTAFFVMCSMKPQYNDKIITMNAMAPVAVLANTKYWFFKPFSVLCGPIQLLLELFGMEEILPRNDIKMQIALSLCSEDALSFPLCKNLFSDNGGYINLTRIPIYISHGPAGSSFKQVAHYSQSVTSGKFAQYDYGSLVNLFRYNSNEPPLYNLSAVVAPVALHYGDGDMVVSETDLTMLYNNLGNSIGMFKVPRISFDHYDSIWALDAKAQLYDKIFSIMKQYDWNL